MIVQFISLIKVMQYHQQVMLFFIKEKISKLIF